MQLPALPFRGWRSRLVLFLAVVGPGFITANVDNDAGGIATYSVAGAQFGYGLLWTVFLTTPFMISIQLVSARIGRVTGKGLAANVMELAPRWMVLALVFLLVTANTFNIAADIAAMGARPRWALLSVGVPQNVWGSDFVDRLYDGLFELARRYDVKLIGGDTSRTNEKIVIDSIVLGECSAGTAVLRSGAKPGDQLFVTGALATPTSGTPSDRW